MKKLIIVESPNKINSLEKYLGINYIVKASVGHIVKLATSGPHGFGVDLKTWVPNYKIDSSKRKFIKEAKQALKKVDDVYIATDPDREGEAIGDNIVNFLDIKNNYKRIRFNEITKKAILKAIEQPTKLDENLVNSQIARRILDRIIGFKLSKIMQLKVKNSPKTASAGRVQSIALKLVREREKLIEDFVPTKYKIVNVLVDLPNKKNLKIPFSLKDSEFDDKTWILPKKYQKIEAKFSKQIPEWLIVKNIKITNRKEKKVIPLKQSTLYKKGNSKFGMSAKAIQNAAQRLYEGYGQGGLISYPRTDSTRFSNTFLNVAKTYILKNYGKEYLLEKVKGKAGDQDAHEAIRPTFLNLTPSKAKKKFSLNSPEFNVYKLIWNHTMQCLIKAPIKEISRYEFSIFDKKLELIDKNWKFKLSYSKVIFDGYYKVIGHGATKQDFFKFEKDEKLKIKKIVNEDKKTLPPSRYNDGSLIEKLDKIKVGRPSTFATIVAILKQRFYVETENKAMKITNFGQIIYDKLINGFPKFMDEKYTAKLEEELNEIAKGKKDYKKMLHLFWKDFEKLVDEQLKNTQVTIIPLEKSEKKCPKCGSNLVIRTNKKSGNKFLGCPKFPKCKHAEPDPNFVSKFKNKFFIKKNKK